MFDHRDRIAADVQRLALVRPATRREVYRRIALATDFLHTHYVQEVDLSTLARMACLSKYHFLRLFTLVHGVTPHTYLQRKRTTVAARLLETTQLTMNEISASVGFGNESTLLRQMRRWTSLTPLQVRTGYRKDSQLRPARIAIGA
jgi:AraC family transcriptional regulator